MKREDSDSEIGVDKREGGSEQRGAGDVGQDVPKLEYSLDREENPGTGRSECASGVVAKENLELSDEMLTADEITSVDSRSSS